MNRRDGDDHQVPIPSLENTGRTIERIVIAGPARADRAFGGAVYMHRAIMAMEVNIQQGDIYILAGAGALTM
jgi:hypothetical protein